MVEEFGGPIESGPSISIGAEGAEGLREEDISRVEQQAKKAKQVSGFIAGSKKNNSMVAQFLTMLLQSLTSDELLIKFHRVFFRMKDKTGRTRIRKNTNNMVMIGIFIPFFQQEAQQLGLHAFFHNIFHFGATPSINEYINYLKRLSYHHHDNIPLEKNALVELLIEVIIHFTLIDTAALTQDKREHYTQVLHKELFDQKSPPPPLSESIQLPHNHDHHGKHGHHHNPYPSPKNQG